MTEKEKKFLQYMEHLIKSARNKKTVDLITLMKQEYLRIISK